MAHPNEPHAKKQKTDRFDFFVEVPSQPADQQSELGDQSTQLFYDLTTQQLTDLQQQFQLGGQIIQQDDQALPLQDLLEGTPPALVTSDQNQQVTAINLDIPFLLSNQSGGQSYVVPTPDGRFQLYPFFSGGATTDEQTQSPAIQTQTTGKTASSLANTNLLSAAVSQMATHSQTEEQGQVLPAVPQAPYLPPEIPTIQPSSPFVQPPVQLSTPDLNPPIEKEKLPDPPQETVYLAQDRDAHIASNEQPKLVGGQFIRRNIDFPSLEASDLLPKLTRSLDWNPVDSPVLGAQYEAVHLLKGLPHRPYRVDLSLNYQNSVPKNFDELIMLSTYSNLDFCNKWRYFNQLVDYAQVRFLN